MSLDVDNAVYPEDLSSFMNPTYAGKCRSVNIIPINDKGEWLCYRVPHLNTISAIMIPYWSSSPPYDVLYKGKKSLGSVFMKRVMNKLTDPYTQFYCMVYKGFSRNYYIMFNVDDNISHPIFKRDDSDYVWIHPSQVPNHNSTIVPFYNGYVDYRARMSYGAQNMCVFDSSILSVLPPSPTRIMRSGVIPYDIVDGEIKFFMGLTLSGKISDWGGGCHANSNELSIHALSRETFQEAGMKNSIYIMSKILDKSETYVWQATVGSPDCINHVVLVRVNLTRFHPVEKNSEMLGSLIVSYTDLIGKSEESIHHPIRSFVSFISSPNVLIGYPCSCINSMGNVTLKSHRVIPITIPTEQLMSYEKYDIYPASVSNMEMRGRVYEDNNHPLIWKLSQEERRDFRAIDLPCKIGNSTARPQKLCF
jgi:hypothetical protein